MDLALVGLGRMGLDMALRGQFGGHPVRGDGAATGEVRDDGTVDVVPGGVRTEGAESRGKAGK